MSNQTNFLTSRAILVCFTVFIAVTTVALAQRGHIPTSDLFYYVDAVGGNDTNEGLTRGSAFATIQKAIETAENGDTILVYPGLYRGEIDFHDKAITVQGVPEDPAGIPVLRNPGDFAVSFFRGENPESALKNFVIRDSFMGVFIAGSIPTLSNLTIVNNTYGIEAYAGSRPDISNCIFWKNTGGDLFGCQARYSWARQDFQPGLVEGAIAHWGFDEDQGSTAYDSAGNKNGTVYGAQRTIGPIGGALKFDGETDYVELPQNNPVWLPQDDFSLSVWVYFERDSLYAHDYGEIILDFNYGASADPENELGYNIQRRGESGKICFQMTTTTNSDEDVYSNEILRPDAWHHIVAVRDRDIQAIYINGRLDASRSCSTDPIDYIGGYDDDRVNFARYTTTVPPPRGHFKGSMDEVMVFGRALSAEEIQQLYQKGAGGVGDPLFADPDNNDYHLLSERGRYWPEHDIWVLDRVTSPCIDGGDPNVEPVDEPIPNGGRINMGAYG
ncbi:MAG: LamG domain-containing protein, partial [Planctomycetota bacterium]